MNNMNFSDKVNFIKSLHCGDYIYIYDIDGYDYLSIVKNVNLNGNAFVINGFASVCVTTPEENNEVGFLYYNVNTLLYKNHNLPQEFYRIRKATKEEIEYFDRLLKEDGNRYSNGKMIKL